MEDGAEGHKGEYGNQIAQSPTTSPTVATPEYGATTPKPAISPTLRTSSANWNSPLTTNSMRVRIYILLMRIRILAANQW